MKSMTTGTFTARTAATLAILMLAFVNGHKISLSNNLSYNANKNSFKCIELAGSGQITCQQTVNLPMTIESLSKE